MSARGRPRLRHLRATNLRTFAELELDDLPDVVLLYGENDAGKSNLLGGVAILGRILALVLAGGRLPFGPEGGEAPWPVGPEEGREWPPSLARLPAFVRYGESSLRLEGSFDCVIEEGVRRLHLAVEGHLGMEGENDRLKVEPLRLDDEPASRAYVRRALAKTVGTGAMMAAEERTWGREYLSGDASGGDHGLGVDDHGAGLKRALFRLANHPARAVRDRFDVDLASIVRASPFSIDAPKMAILADNLVEVVVGEHPVEHLGSGARQWVWLAAWAVAADAAILAIEEPETSLSWRSQLQVAGLIRALAEKTGAQVFASTHAPLMVEAAAGQAWFRVRRSGGLSLVDPRRGGDELWEGRDRPARVPEGPGRKTLMLFDGNVVRLHEDSVAHLGARVGDRLVSSEGEPGVVKIETERHYLGDE